MARARTLSAPYFCMIHCNNNKLLYDQIDPKLIGSNIYWKKRSQTVTIDKDDCAFSVVYSLLKIRVKHIYLKISLEFLGGRINHVGKNCRHDTVILLFVLAIVSGFAECRRELKKLHYKSNLHKNCQRYSTRD